jgi:hypothetical protein
LKKKHGSEVCHAVTPSSAHVDSWPSGPPVPRKFKTCRNQKALAPRFGYTCQLYSMTPFSDLSAFGRSPSFDMRGLYGVRYLTQLARSLSSPDPRFYQRTGFATQEGRLSRVLSSVPIFACPTGSVKSLLNPDGPVIGCCET